MSERGLEECYLCGSEKAEERTQLKEGGSDDDIISVKVCKKCLLELEKTNL